MTDVVPIYSGGFGAPAGFEAKNFGTEGGQRVDWHTSCLQATMVAHRYQLCSTQFLYIKATLPGSAEDTAIPEYSRASPLLDEARHAAAFGINSCPAPRLGR